MEDITSYKDWEDAYKMILNYNWFPEDTIIRDYKLKNNLTADIVISINEPLAILEIKVWKVDLKECTKQLIDMIYCFDKPIEWYLIIIDNPKKWSLNPAKYYKLNLLEQNLEPINYFPNYWYFKWLKTKKIISDLNKSNKLFIWLSVTLWIFFIIYHFILLWINHDITNNQLIILLTWILLIMLPFFSNIKIAWMELSIVPKWEKIEEKKDTK